jgi:hypothetical protein
MRDRIVVTLLMATMMLWSGDVYVHKGNACLLDVETTKGVLANDPYISIMEWARSDPQASERLDEWLSEPDEENEDVPSGAMNAHRKWLLRHGLPYTNEEELRDYLRSCPMPVWRSKLP